MGDPYIGTLSSNITWNPPYPGNTVYVSSSTQSLTVYTGYTLTVSSGLALSINGEFVIRPGAAVTANSITNNGLIKLQSDESGIASLIHTGYTGSGVTHTEIYLTGGFTTVEGIDYYKWHYISSPVNNVPVSVFTGPGYTLNLAQYVENIVADDPVTGWVAFDGYVYEPEGQNNDYSFSSLSLGKGYNYYHTVSETYTMSGSLNINDIIVTLGFSGGYPDSQGFNLIGNPFSSCFDWDYLFNNGLIPPNVNDAIYFTVDGGYGSYVNGVGQGGGGPIIPPMQGFFVKAIEDGAQIILPNEARIHDLNQPRYKGENGKNLVSSKSIPLVRIKLENQKDSDDLVVRFDKMASNLFDKSFDAYKLNSSGSKVSLWTKTGDIEYSINGLPFPEVSVEIPILLFTSSSENYRISASEIIGMEKYSIILKDLQTNTIKDISKGESIEVFLGGGVIENRFLLEIKINPETDIPEKKFNIFSSSGSISIVSLTDEFTNYSGIVSIYDLSGKRILQQSEVKWDSMDDQKQFAIKSGNSGIYIIEIRIGNQRFTEKVNFTY